MPDCVDSDSGIVLPSHPTVVGIRTISLNSTQALIFDANSTVYSKIYLVTKIR